MRAASVNRALGPASCSTCRACRQFCTLPPRRRVMRAKASNGVQNSSSDHYVTAMYRLQSLIANVGDGEEELYNNMLLEEGPEYKLQVQCVVAALVMTASTTICWLCGKDPAGGASLSWHSLQAAALGAAAAIPLVGYKWASWSSQAHKANASIAALQRARTEARKPWLTGMGNKQLAAHLALDTMPTLFLLLPTVQAVMAASYGWTKDWLGVYTMVNVPPDVGFALAVAVTALINAAAESVDLVANPDQVKVVVEAMQNAERYYRVVATGTTSNSSDDSSSSSQEAEAARAATAFKAVALAWREEDQNMASVFMAMRVLDFMYLGMLWWFCRDMTAPCVAALLANAVDYHYMWSRVKQGERDGGRGSHKQRQGSTQRE